MGRAPACPLPPPVVVLGMRRTSLALFLLLFLPAAAEAQPSGPGRMVTGPGIVQELALAVAKVCANEAGLERPRPADCALIWQVTQGHGETPAAQLAWLRGHSRCVLGDTPPTARRLRGGGNCVWARNLTASDAEPDGWPSRLAWEGRHAERWERKRAFCLRLVLGYVTRRPCETTPQTWGGRRDRRRVARYGYRPVACRGTLNDGYDYPPRERR